MLLPHSLQRLLLGKAGTDVAESSPLSSQRSCPVPYTTCCWGRLRLELPSQSYISVKKNDSVFLPFPYYRLCSEERNGE